MRRVLDREIRRVTGRERPRRDRPRRAARRGARSRGVDARRAPNCAGRGARVARHGKPTGSARPRTRIEARCASRSLRAGPSGAAAPSGRPRPIRAQHHHVAAAQDRPHPQSADHLEADADQRGASDVGPERRVRRPGRSLRRREVPDRSTPHDDPPNTACADRARTSARRERSRSDGASPSRAPAADHRRSPERQRTGGRPTRGRTLPAHASSAAGSDAPKPTRVSTRAKSAASGPSSLAKRGQRGGHCAAGAQLGTNPFERIRDGGRHRKATAATAPRQRDREPTSTPNPVSQADRRAEASRPARRSPRRQPDSTASSGGLHAGVVQRGLHGHARRRRRRRVRSDCKRSATAPPAGKPPEASVAIADQRGRRCARPPRFLELVAGAPRRSAPAPLHCGERIAFPSEQRTHRDGAAPCAGPTSATSTISRRPSRGARPRSRRSPPRAGCARRPAAATHRGHERLEPSGARRTVHVHRRQRPVVAGVERLQHVEGLAATHFAHDETVRAHPQRAHELAHPDAPTPSALAGRLRAATCG